jgi:hypothetical protein
MPRRAATVTEAELRRAIRAGKKEDASEVVVTIPGGTIITYRLNTEGENKHFDEEEVVL